MSLTPGVLAVLVEERRRAVARDLVVARRAGLRRTAAGLVLALGSGITALGTVLDEQPRPADAVNSATHRAR